MLLRFIQIHKIFASTNIINHLGTYLILHHICIKKYCEIVQMGFNIWSTSTNFPKSSYIVLTFSKHVILSKAYSPSYLSAKRPLSSASVSSSAGSCNPYRTPCTIWAPPSGRGYTTSRSALIYTVSLLSSERGESRRKSLKL